MTNRIAIQVDGVFADFNAAAAEALRQLYPNKQCDTDWPQEEGKLDPYTDEEYLKFARTAPGIPSWWLRLAPHRETVAEWYSFLTFGLGMLFDVYYVAIRQGPLVHAQTQTWLKRMGIWQDNCSLLTIGSAAELQSVTNSLSIKHVISHRASTLDLLRSTIFDCSLYMVERPYNRPGAKIMRGTMMDIATRISEQIMPQGSPSALNPSVQ